MDPNLLPSELRNKEEQEQARHKKQAADFGLELNSFKKEVQQKNSRPSANRGGLWQRLFGPAKQPAQSEKLTEPALESFHASSVDLLSPAKSIKVSPVFNRQPDNRRLQENHWKNQAPIAKPPALPRPEQHEMEKITLPRANNLNSKPAVIVEKKKAKSVFQGVPKREKASEVSVNLMPQELVSAFSAGGKQNFISLAIAIIIPALIITVGYGLIILLQDNLKSRMAERQQEFADLQKQIGDFIQKENQNNQVADKVSAIKKLLDEKIIWDNFFTSLEKYTLDGVSFDSLSADTSGVLSLPGLADDYNVLARQLAAFRDANDFIKDVKLTNAQLASSGKGGVIGVSFQIRLVLQDNIFRNSAVK